jgi:hypothetical protein
MNLKKATLGALETEMARRLEDAACEEDMEAMADMLDRLETLAFYGIVALGFDEAKSLVGVDIFCDHLRGKVTHFINRQDINGN